MLAIRLPMEIETRLDHLAKLTGRTKTYYAREAIIEHLNDLEDIYMAEERMHEIRRSAVKPVPLSKVMKKYGMES